MGPIAKVGRLFTIQETFKSIQKSWSRYSFLIGLLVKRDLRVRYRNSVLGYFWSMMNPLLQMGILAFVFSHLMRFKIDDFPLFILSGVIIWNLFHQSLSMGVQSIVGNGALLKKVKVPVAIFPVVSVASTFVNFLLSIGPYFVIALFYDRIPTALFFLVPILVLPFLLFIVGCNLGLASLNVKYRDIGHVIEPVLSIVFYATPIIYPENILPAKYADLVWLNPLAIYVKGFRDLVFNHRLPDLMQFGFMMAIGLVVFFFGYAIYRKSRHDLVYYV